MPLEASLKRGGNSAVECQLPKLDVAGSIPVPRSTLSIHHEILFGFPSSASALACKRRIGVLNEITEALLLRWLVTLVVDPPAMAPYYHAGQYFR